MFSFDRSEENESLLYILYLVIQMILWIFVFQYFPTLSIHEPSRELGVCFVLFVFSFFPNIKSYCVSLIDLECAV